MRRVLVVFLSLVTGIGGHYVNRRRDKALLFFGMILLWSVGIYVGMTLYASHIIGVDSFEDVQSAIRKFWKLPTVGLLVIWLGSIIVAYRDSAKPLPEKEEKWAAAKIFKAALLSIFCGFILFYEARTLSHWVSLPDNVGVADQRYSDINLPGKITKGITFKIGGIDRSATDFLALPKGKGYFTGKLELGKKALSEIPVKLILNGFYETETVTTDSMGIFVLNLPVGAWYVNGITVQAWEDGIDPYAYVVGAERGGGAPSVEYPANADNDSGQLIKVSEDIAAVPFVFVIRSAIEMVWPLSDKRPAKASVDESVIGWQPYPGASDYLVKISARRQNGDNGKETNLVFRHAETKTGLPLSQLHTVEAANQGGEYLVTVYALDADGFVLSNSGEDGISHTFVLTDDKIIVGEVIEQDGPGKKSFNDTQLFEIEQNRQRLDATVALLEDGLLEEAGRMLNKVEGPVLPGRLEAVKGYYLARAGKCEEAGEMFAGAIKKNPTLSIPSFYRANCPGN